MRGTALPDAGSTVINCEHLPKRWARVSQTYPKLALLAAIEADLTEIEADPASTEGVVDEFHQAATRAIAA